MKKHANLCTKCVYKQSCESFDPESYLDDCGLMRYKIKMGDER